MRNNGLSSRHILIFLSLSLISFLIISHATMVFAVEGSILLPENGHQVDGVYEIKGTVKDLPNGSVYGLQSEKAGTFGPKTRLLSLVIRNGQPMLTNPLLNLVARIRSFYFLLTRKAKLKFQIGIASMRNKIVGQQWSVALRVLQHLILSMYVVDKKKSML